MYDDTMTVDKAYYNKLKEQTTWVSVEDRLPESMIYDYPCFLVTDGSLIHMAYFVENEWMFADSGQAKDKMFYKVSHWMPLPELPEHKKALREEFKEDG